MRTAVWKALALTAGLALVASACGDDDDDDAGAATSEAPAGEAPATGMPADEGEDASGTIPEVAAAAGSFTTLLAAAEAAGLVDDLSGPGPLTVFAPTDDAFAAAALESLGLTAEELLADTETLTSILTFHVVPGEVPAVDVLAADTLTTLNGAELTVDAEAATVSGETTATIVTTDVAASNGLIHVIDAVLLPPT